MSPFCGFPHAAGTFIYLYFKDKCLDASRPFTPLLFIAVTGKWFFFFKDLLNHAISLLKTFDWSLVRNVMLAQINLVSSSTCPHPWHSSPDPSYSAFVWFHITLSFCNILLSVCPSIHPLTYCWRLSWCVLNNHECCDSFPETTSWALALTVDRVHLSSPCGTLWISQKAASLTSMTCQLAWLNRAALAGICLPGFLLHAAGWIS